MTNKKAIIYVLAVSAVLSTGCTRRQERSRNADKYDQWLESLTDSVAALQETQKLTEDSLTALYTGVDEMLRKFSYVDNPREVEGYTILSSRRGSYPLTRTGISARIAKSEDFEIIAVLSGGSFTHITLSDGTSTAGSATVPHDQGLNYRSGNLNTVLFSGPEADSIGMFVAKDPSRSITVAYGNRSERLQPSDAQMIAETWTLAKMRKDIRRMELSIPVISKKIDACRRKMEQRKEK